MAAKRDEDMPNPPDLSTSKNRSPRAPREVIELLDLPEIAQRFNRTWYHVYAAVARGELRAYGRPGHQKYYALHELEAAFRGKENGDPGKVTDVSPGKARGFEYGERAA